jgi:hypothetical protein
MGTAVEDFLAEMLPKQVAAETAIHNGDPELRLALWSRTDPVTLFGARDSGTGWNDLSAIFHNVASWFSDSAEYDFEVVAAGASGDLAYAVGYEHNRVKVDGQPRTYTLRSPTYTGARTDSGASCTATATSRPLPTNQSHSPRPWLPTPLAARQQ